MEVPGANWIKEAGPAGKYRRQPQMSAIWPMIPLLAWVHHGTEDRPRTPASAREHDVAGLGPCTINGLGEVSDEAYPHRTTEGSERTPVA